MVDSLADRVDQLEKELNETLETNIGMASRIKSFQKDDILGELSDDLTDIEVEKLKGLSEGVGFEDADQYRNSLETIRENYFQKTSSGKRTVIDEESEITESADAAPVSSQMSAYVSTLGRTV